MSVTHTSTEMQQQRSSAKAILATQPRTQAGEIVRIRPETPAPLIPRAIAKIIRTVQYWRWKRKLQALGEKSVIRSPAWFCGCESISIGDRVSIWSYARFEALNASRDVTRIRIGDDTGLQRLVHIGAIKSVTIGKCCMIGAQSFITDHDHDYSNPFDPMHANDRAIAASVEIGDYVYLGEQVMVLKGVKIGERSMIGAGSIVTKDVPPLSIAVGSPAKVIRRWNEHLQQWVSPEKA
jgi:acetyltransferase-like isoleucine patch superfamily enzyme